MAKHNDGLDDLFAGLPEPGAATSATSAPPAADDPLAELDELESLAERPKPRSETPRSAPKRSIERARTPGTGYGLPMSARNSAEIKRASSPVPAASMPKKAEKESAPPPLPQSVDSSSGSGEGSSSAASSSGGGGVGGGGWGWGSLWNTATTAVKAAEGLVQEIQQSEEGKKWVAQVGGGADVLRGLGGNSLPTLFTQVLIPLAGDVRSKAMPTFANLLNHLAPPISSHEQLRIHITHDLQNYPFVDNVVFGVFDRVMQQVEGGDLLVVQRGSGSKPRSSVDGGAFGGGPWWKAMEKVPSRSRKS